MFFAFLLAYFFFFSVPQKHHSNSLDIRKRRTNNETLRLYIEQPYEAAVVVVIIYIQSFMRRTFDTLYEWYGCFFLFIYRQTHTYTLNVWISNNSNNNGKTQNHALTACSVFTFCLYNFVVVKSSITFAAVMELSIDSSYYRNHFVDEHFHT